MKRSFFAIPLLLISFFFVFFSRSFAAGQTCCNTGWSTGLTGTSLDPNKCCNAVANYCVDTSCGTNESCSSNVCITKGDITPATSTSSCCPQGGVPNGTSCMLGTIVNGNVCPNNVNSYCDTSTPPATCATVVGPTIPPSANCGHTSIACCDIPNVNQCDPGLDCDNVGGKKLCLNPSQCAKTGLCSSSATTGPNPIFCNGNEADGINTALGCIKVGSGNDLITTILRLATGVGGGLALALILYGVFIVTTSAGSPDKLKAGSEIITSAIIGLIFILLSVFLVNLIGINILGIPGLS